MDLVDDDQTRHAISSLVGQQLGELGVMSKMLWRSNQKSCCCRVAFHGAGGGEKVPVLFRRAFEQFVQIVRGDGPVGLVRGGELGHLISREGVEHDDNQNDAALDRPGDAGDVRLPPPGTHDDEDVSRLGGISKVAEDARLAGAEGRLVPDGGAGGVVVHGEQRLQRRSRFRGGAGWGNSLAERWMTSRLVNKSDLKSKLQLGPFWLT